MYADWGSMGVRVGEAHVLNMHLAPAIYQHSDGIWTGSSKPRGGSTSNISKNRCRHFGSHWRVLGCRLGGNSPTCQGVLSLWRCAAYRVAWRLQRLWIHNNADRRSSGCVGWVCIIRWSKTYILMVNDDGKMSTPSQRGVLSWTHFTNSHYHDVIYIYQMDRFEFVWIITNNSRNSGFNVLAWLWS